MTWLAKHARSSRTKPIISWLSLPRGIARLLGCAVLVETAGVSLYLTIGLLYFTRVMHLPVAQVGAVMTGAAVVGLLIGVPVAHLADRYGARPVLVWAVVGQAVATATYALVDSLTTYALTACLAVAFERTAYAARGAIMGELPQNKDKITTRAKLRSIGQIGAAVGGAAGGLVLQLDDPSAYRTALLTNGVLLLISAYVSTRMPDVKQLSSSGGLRLEVLRDRPYLTLASMNALLAMHFGLFEVAMPFWIVHHTTVPEGLVGGLFVLNTTMIVVFQMLFSRGTEEPHSASKVMARVGFIFLLACLAFALSGSQTSLSVPLLVIATSVYTIGEMMHIAGGWGVSFALAPPGRHAQYQALWGTSTAAGIAAGPLITTTLVLPFGITGWLAVGTGFALASCFFPTVMRWALRTRTRNGDDSAYSAGEADTGVAESSIVKES
ncbi:MFS transporter [Streptomyces decoyicus]|uniref:MFS transporter n=1 Tax=Streptomyces decoyicus TaxID=249567 RepID=UPI0037FF09BC